MSKIEWTEKTWNPIAGCSKVSQGCTHCYAETMAKRLAAMGQQKYQGLISLDRWNGQIRFDGKSLLEPLKRKKPTVYFVNSMSDLFHENVPDEWIDQIFAVMALCPQHTFQVLTKRPERMQYYLSRGDDEHGDYFERLSDAAVEVSGSPCAAHIEDVNWPLSNVWLGVSVENQQAADERIPLLLQTTAAVRFLSCEPLLGSVEFSDVSRRSDAVRVLGQRALSGIHWVIVGGESGPGARPMHPDWVRSLRDQCQAAGVPFFFKQWGAWGPLQTDEGEWPTDTETCIRLLPDGTRGDGGWPMQRVGKKFAGRILEGRTWDETPEVQHA